MSKLNTKNSGLQVGTMRHSYNGNLQAVKSDKQQLFELAVCSLYGKDNFYESTNKMTKRVEQLINSLVKQREVGFVANTIIYARKKMNIRTMPIVMTVHFAMALHEHKVQFKSLRHVVSSVIDRADQITDLVAYHLTVNGNNKGKISRQVKLGIADAFNKFDEYNFGKYKNSGSLKFSNVLRMVHPRAKSVEQGAIFDKIMAESDPNRSVGLEVPYTWEVELSVNGQKPLAERKSDKQLWEELIDSGKVGYMATLRNLRNMMQADVSSAHRSIVCAKLSDEKEVLKSKQLPFRFVSALDAIKDHSKPNVVSALHKALDISLGNLPKIGNHVWIIIDASYSMTWNNGDKGGGIPIKTACLFAAALYKANKDSDNVRISMFSDDCIDVRLPNPDSTVMDISNHFVKYVCGGGTNLQSALDKKASLGFEPDTVIVLSDMQVNSLSSRNVGALFSKDCVKVAVNINAYGTTPIGDVNGWYQLAGFSEKIFEFIPAFRNKDSVVKVLSKPYNS